LIPGAVKLALRSIGNHIGDDLTQYLDGINRKPLVLNFPLGNNIVYNISIDFPGGPITEADEFSFITIPFNMKKI